MAYCDASDPLLLIKIAECACDALGAALMLGEGVPVWWASLAFSGLVLTRSVAVILHAAHMSSRSRDVMLLCGEVPVQLVVALQINSWPCPSDAHSAAVCAWPLQGMLASLNGAFMLVDLVLTLSARSEGEGSNGLLSDMMI